MDRVKRRRGSCRATEIEEDPSYVFHVGVSVQGSLEKFSVLASHFSQTENTVTFYHKSEGEKKVFAYFTGLVFLIRSDKEIIDETSVQSPIFPKDWGKMNGEYF